MNERLRNGQMVGIISKEDPNENGECKIELARIVHYNNIVRLSFDRGRMEPITPLISLKGEGIQYTFPELSGILSSKKKVSLKK